MINLPVWDLSEWSSVGTLAALVFGLYVYAQGQREARREQAALISAWFQAPDVQAQTGPPANVTLFISNRSEQPVYAVTVWSLRVLAEGEGVAVLPPGTTYEAEGAAGMMWEGDQYAAELFLVFTDARSRKWQRVNGKLVRRRWLRRRWSERLGAPKAIFRIESPPEDDEAE